MRRQGASESSKGTSRASGACLLNRDSHFNVSAGSWCCCHSLDQPATIAAKRLGSSSVASRATSSGSHSLHSLIRLTGRQGQQSCQTGFSNRRISSERLQHNKETGQRRTSNRRSRSRCDRSKDERVTKPRSAVNCFDSGVEQVRFNLRSYVLHSDRACEISCSAYTVLVVDFGQRASRARLRRRACEDQSTPQTFYCMHVDR